MRDRFAGLASVSSSSGSISFAVLVRGTVSQELRLGSGPSSGSLSSNVTRIISRGDVFARTLRDGIVSRLSPCPSSAASPSCSGSPGSASAVGSGRGSLLRSRYPRLGICSNSSRALVSPSSHPEIVSSSSGLAGRILSGEASLVAQPDCTRKIQKYNAGWSAP